MRTIDADALEVVTAKVPKGMDAKSYMAGMEYVLNQIDALPTIEERKTGKWIQDQKSKRYRCDQCLSFALKTDDMQENLSDFCPVCGADMREQP